MNLNISNKGKYYVKLNKWTSINEIHFCMVNLWNIQQWLFCYNFSKKFQKITKFNILIIAFKMKFR